MQLYVENYIIFFSKIIHEINEKFDQQTCIYYLYCLKVK